MLQLYTVQCDSGIDMDALVQVQCSALPLDCTQPSPISAGSDIRTVIFEALQAAVSQRIYSYVLPYYLALLKSTKDYSHMTITGRKRTLVHLLLK